MGMKKYVFYKRGSEKEGIKIILQYIAVYVGQKSEGKNFFSHSTWLFIILKNILSYCLMAMINFRKIEFKL